MARVSTTVIVINLLLFTATLSSVQSQSECTEGSVEFVGLSVSYAGIVRVCVDGVWGTICSESAWSLKNCQVACRSAGYSGAVSPILQDTLSAISRRAVSNDPVHYIDVVCDGTESQLSQCSTSDDTRGCETHLFDVAATCRNDATPTPGDVRLLGDARDGVGAVEFYQQTFGWTGICADLFSDDDWLANTEAATIVCRQLGFEEGITYIEDLEDNEGIFTSRRVIVTECDAVSDFTLNDCDTARVSSCASPIGGIRCTLTDVEDYSVRLVEGDEDGRNGVVEVAFNGRWGTICEDSSWDVESAAAVCDQLGLDSDSDPTVLYSGANSQSVQPYWLGGVSCTSDDSSLSDCAFVPPIGYTTCTATSPAAQVDCGDPPGEGLGGGAVAGIVIGSVVGVGLVVVFCHYYQKNEKKKRTAAATRVQRSSTSAPAPAPVIISTISTATVSLSEPQPEPERPDRELTDLAPPSYQAAVSYPTAHPPSYPPEKVGPFPYTPAVPTAPSYPPSELPYPVQDTFHHPAYPPPTHGETHFVS